MTGVLLDDRSSSFLTALKDLRYHCLDNKSTKSLVKLHESIELLSVTHLGSASLGRPIVDPPPPPSLAFSFISLNISFEPTTFET